MYTWNSTAENSVGAEYIIMEKMPGVRLLHVWDQLKLTDKLQVVTQLFKFQKMWLSARFVKIGSLYYADDVETGAPRRPSVYQRQWKGSKRTRVLLLDQQPVAIGLMRADPLWNCDRGPCKMEIQLRTYWSNSSQGPPSRTFTKLSSDARSMLQRMRCTFPSRW